MKMRGLPTIATNVLRLASWYGHSHANQSPNAAAQELDSTAEIAQQGPCVTQLSVTLFSRITAFPLQHQRSIHQHASLSMATICIPNLLFSSR